MRKAGRNDVSEGLEMRDDTRELSKRRRTKTRTETHTMKQCHMTATLWPDELLTDGCHSDVLGPLRRQLLSRYSTSTCSGPAQMILTTKEEV